MATLQPNEFRSLLQLLASLRSLLPLGARVLAASLLRLRISLHSMDPIVWQPVDIAIAKGSQNADDSLHCIPEWRALELLSICVGAWLVGDQTGFEDASALALASVQAISGRARPAPSQPLAHAVAEQYVASVQATFQGPAVAPGVAPQSAPIPASLPTSAPIPGLSPNGHPTNASAAFLPPTPGAAPIQPNAIATPVGGGPPTPEHSELLKRLEAQRAEAEKAAAEKAGA